MASWLSQDTVEILSHLLGNFIAAMVLFAAAIGLAFVEKWCVENKLPDYISYGVTGISFTLFALDGIVICGTATIVSFRLLRKTWRNEI